MKVAPIVKRNKKPRGTLPVMNTELYQMALASVDPPEPAPGTPEVLEDEDVDFAQLVEFHDKHVGGIEAIDHRVVRTLMIAMMNVSC